MKPPTSGEAPLQRSAEHLNLCNRVLWNSVLARLKKAVKNTPLAVPWIRAKALITKPVTQNEEALILQTLLRRFTVPKNFVEFGFGGWEFNCAPLALDWEGLLLDGDPYNVKIARTILPNRVKAEQLWITRETLSVVREWAASRHLGILSIDVDGNDYWFLEGLIDLKPAVIISEYNSIFGLQPITVPYDPAFDYERAHPSRFYWGASLTALHHLASNNGYSLIEVGNSGVNAFFVRNDLLGPDDIPLPPQYAFRERDWQIGLRRSEQWEQIKNMPFVDVTKLNQPA